MTSKGRAMQARIVAGAAEVVRERGPANTGLDDIRAATGVSSSQLFHYFPDGKRALMLAVARYEADRILTEQEPHLSDLSTAECWREWAHNLVARYQRQGSRCGLSALVSQLDPGNEDVREIVVDLYRRWEEALAIGVSRLQNSNGSDGALDPQREAAHLLTSIQGGVTILMATGSADYLEEALRSTVDRLTVGHEHI
jgi:AcrR family transcriptional regulator